MARVIAQRLAEKKKFEFNLFCSSPSVWIKQKKGSWVQHPNDIETGETCLLQGIKSYAYLKFCGGPSFLPNFEEYSRISHSCHDNELFATECAAVQAWRYGCFFCSRCQLAIQHRYGFVHFWPLKLLGRNGQRMEHFFIRYQSAEVSRLCMLAPVLAILPPLCWYNARQYFHAT